MSTSADAVAVIGCRIPAQKLYCKKKKMHHALCEHRNSFLYGDEWRVKKAATLNQSKCPAQITTKHCPECGKPAFVEVVTMVDGIEIDYDEEQKCHTLNGLPLFGERRGFPFAVVGTTFAHSHTGGYPDNHYTDGMQLLPTDIEEAKKKCKVVLEPLGLWDEDNFGLWAVAELC
jgi:hypothetical protein